MQDHDGYGQYCPLSMAAGILCNRWTMLVLRQLLKGSTGFNEIRRVRDTTIGNCELFHYESPSRRQQ